MRVYYMSLFVRVWSFTLAIVRFLPIGIAHDVDAHIYNRTHKVLWFGYFAICFVCFGFSAHWLDFAVLLSNCANEKLCAMQPRVTNLEFYVEIIRAVTNSKTRNFPGGLDNTIEIECENRIRNCSFYCYSCVISLISLIRMKFIVRILIFFYLEFYDTHNFVSSLTWDVSNEFRIKYENAIHACSFSFTTALFSVSMHCKSQLALPLSVSILLVDRVAIWHGIAFILSFLFVFCFTAMWHLMTS